ncbi:MAG: hypothetical protein KDB14_17360 [Planctomycetales bacterium]|nr:hypothetical protein [Planctomycetales bacterium]
MGVDELEAKLVYEIIMTELSRQGLSELVFEIENAIARAVVIDRDSAIRTPLSGQAALGIAVRSLIAALEPAFHLQYIQKTLEVTKETSKRGGHTITWDIDTDFVDPSLDISSSRDTGRPDLSSIEPIPWVEPSRLDEIRDQALRILELIETVEKA